MTADMGLGALESNRSDDLVLTADWWPTGHLTFYAANEHRSLLADVCSGLVEFMVLDCFLVGHAARLKVGQHPFVIVGDDRDAPERLADADDAVIESVHEKQVRIDFGQSISNVAHGLDLSGVG